MSVPAQRIQKSNTAPINLEGDFVLYWMTANRRLTWNFSLQRAVEHAVELGKPLLIFEALRVGYEWASVRFHRFVIQGMADNKAASAKANVSYYAYVEPTKGAGSGLLAELAKSACVVVTDDFPCFFLPRMLQAVAPRLPVLVEAVDSNGLYPMHDTERVFTRAFSFRIHLQKTLTPFLSEFPAADPLKTKKLNKTDSLPKSILKRWPAASDKLLSGDPAALADFPIDQNVGPALLDGGNVAARKQGSAFVNKRLDRYADDRNQPDDDPSSGL